jgi:glutamate racemase
MLSVMFLDSDGRGHDQGNTGRYSGQAPFDTLAGHGIDRGRLDTKRGVAGVTLRIGLFDSGLGGLSVWREVVALRPDFDTCYVADQAHIPYGARSAAEITRWSLGIARFLAARECDAIVVACNTASAAALETIRRSLPAIPIVGMEPAVKPAAEITRRGIVGVLATPATFQGELFAATVERFAAGVEVLSHVCPGLVECIEAGDVDGPRPETILRAAIAPSLAAGADALVLACTHYAFVRPLLERLTGPEVRIVDPAPAIARQLDRVVGSPPIRDRSARHHFWTTGDAQDFARSARTLVGGDFQPGILRWPEDDSIPAPA